MKGLSSNLMFMILAVSVVSSCGKTNKSGSQAVTTAPAGTTVISTGSNTAPTNWYIENVNDPTNKNNYNKFKNHYQAKTLAHGLKNNMVIYHQGPVYGGTSFNNFSANLNLNFDFGYCINLFGSLKGDCANNQNIGSSTFNNGLQSMLDRGEYMTVRTIGTNSVALDIADSVSNSGFVSTPYTYDRKDEVYIDMLNLDNKPFQKVVISKAIVNVRIIPQNNYANIPNTTNTTNYNNNTNFNNNTNLNLQGQVRQIRADYIEYFYNDSKNTIKGFVVSPEIPFIANPVVNTENHNLTGLLDIAGTFDIISVTVDIHQIQFDPRTGRTQTIKIGTRQLKI